MFRFRRIFAFLKYIHLDKTLFIANGLKGAKEFLLKEKPEASPQARMRMRIFQVLHYLIQFLGVYYMMRFALRSLYAYATSHWTSLLYFEQNYPIVIKFNTNCVATMVKHIHRIFTLTSQGTDSPPHYKTLESFTGSIHFNIKR